MDQERPIDYEALGEEVDSLFTPEEIAGHGRDKIIRELARIIQFRNDVVAGRHPRIKLPSSPSLNSEKNESTLRDLPVAPLPIPTITITSPDGEFLAPEFYDPSTTPELTCSVAHRKRSISRPKLSAPRAFPSSSSTTSIIVPSQPRPEVVIDFKHNYYKDLGIEPHVDLPTIYQALAHKNEKYSPLTVGGKKRWFAKVLEERRRTMDKHYKAQKAFKILSHHEMRIEYHEGYCGEPIYGATGEDGTRVLLMSRKSVEKMEGNGEDMEIVEVEKIAEDVEMTEEEEEGSEEGEIVEH